eukprot:571532-Hanusia_phi.AAC.5
MTPEVRAKYHYLPAPDDDHNIPGPGPGPPTDSCPIGVQSQTFSSLVEKVGRVYTIEGVGVADGNRRPPSCERRLSDMAKLRGSRGGRMGETERCQPMQTQQNRKKFLDTLVSDRSYELMVQ